VTGDDAVGGALAAPDGTIRAVKRRLVVGARDSTGS
jgi:hypothetical protein